MASVDNETVSGILVWKSQWGLNPWSWTAETSGSQKHFRIKKVQTRNSKVIWKEAVRPVILRHFWVEPTTNCNSNETCIFQCQI